MTTTLLPHIASQLSFITNSATQISGCRQVFGGDINTTYILTTNSNYYFIKLNDAAFADMHLKEKDGLALLRAANTSLKIPEPLLCGTHGRHSYLLMEFLEKSTDTKIGWQQLATGLAQLHQTTQSSFGLSYNNYIGLIAQDNTKAATWTEFYAEQRIMPLMRKAFNLQKCSTADVQLAQQFCRHLPILMLEEQPALLHGDLWSGNKSFITNEKAAVYDPAIYFGHREMDIAMTLLFGGFHAHFYDAYNTVYPLQTGWQQRAAICQLYPLLVHLILFGKQYYASVINILKKFA